MAEYNAKKSWTKPQKIILVKHLYDEVISLPNTYVQICNTGVDKYEFGFNGQLKSNEISCVTNHNTALFWKFDPRLAKRRNLDPVIHTWESGYATLGNSPILFADILGDDKTTTGTNIDGDKTTVTTDDKGNVKEAGVTAKRVPKPQAPKSNDGSGGGGGGGGSNTESDEKSSITKALPVVIGFIGMTADGIKDAGGIKNAQNLIKSGKFQAVYNGELKLGV